MPTSTSTSTSTGVSTSQETVLIAKVEETTFNSDVETPASTRPSSSYPFPDFSPPSTRPPSSHKFPDLIQVLPPPTRPTNTPSDLRPSTITLFPKPPTSTPRSRRGSKSKTKPPVAFRARSSSSLLDEFFLHPERRTVWQDSDQLAQRQQTRDMDRQAVGDLVDFLRNHAPPPDNFMSIPDDADADDRGRWLKLKPFTNRRSKSAPRRLKPLRLPDTAVAGRTIGGHRHIAISIPVEHSPFGRNPRSQYPVFTKGGEFCSGGPESVMRYTDSNGVVTVLRTVTEIQESPVRDTFTSSARKFRPPVSVTSEPSRMLLSRTRSLSGPRDGYSRDYNTASLPPTPLHRSRSCHLDSEGACDVRREESPTIPRPNSRAKTPTSATAPSTPGRRKPIPRRWSAFQMVSHGPAESIDGVMYGRRLPPANGLSSPPPSRGGRPRPSTAGALNVSNKTVTDTNIPKVVPMIRVSPGRDTKADLRVDVQSPAAEQESNASKPLEPPSPSARSFDSRQSRKERVREKKRRDIEASRASKERRKSVPGDDSRRRSSSATPSDISRGKTDNESENADSGSLRSPKVVWPSISPITVIADVEPSTPPGTPPAQPSPSFVLARSPCTPLLAVSSPSHTPRGRSPARDCTSFSRPRGYTKPSAGRRSTVSPARLMRLSPNRVAYEERMLEMERRMRKLESSGDMWLSSVIPVLDNLNRTLIMIQDERKVPDGAEEEEGQGTERKTPAVLPLSKLTRRSTLNEKMLHSLRRVEKGTSEDEAKEGSGLESVMRELQEASMEWLPPREEVVVRTEETGLAI